ncbi:MAG: serine/threonine protein kinase [Candidatus Obscuribacterales bacterium]
MKLLTINTAKKRCSTISYSGATGAAFRERFRKLRPEIKGIVDFGFIGATIALLLGAFSYYGNEVSMLAVTAAAIPLLFLAGVLGWFLYASDSVIIAERGLMLPSCYFLSLGGKCTRLWNDISDITINIAGDGEDSPIRHGGASIKLEFFSGGSAELKLSGFDPQGLNTLVNAMEEWATRCKPDKRLSQLPRLLELERTEEKNRPNLSYTRFWEEQLRDNYTFTAFVPLNPGARLKSNSLRVIKQIGSGGFSAIYLVEDDEKVRYVVKESVVPDHLNDEHKSKVREHFQREARILLKLGHERIASVYDHFVEEGRDYLLLQYIEGSDTREILGKNNHQSIEDVIAWSLDLTEVLDYLHSQEPPVIHRDVTPDNMLLDDKGRLNLIDFGAANEYIGQATGTLVGKQAYMPPEQVRGKCSTRSDLYGLGASIHFFLTGRDPEPLASSTPSTLREDVPEELDRLVQSLTRLDESDRPRDIRAVREVLLRLAAGSPAVKDGSDLQQVGG